jgi:hypothetical protein
MIQQNSYCVDVDVLALFCGKAKESQSFLYWKKRLQKLLNRFGKTARSTGKND